jgi:hypothetical protein
MKYDDAEWHFDSTPLGPDDARWAVASAHIGTYLKWCVEKGWAGEIHTEGEPGKDAVDSLKDGTITGSDFLVRECDCQFTDEDLVTEGNLFTAYYYDKYAEDLQSIVGIALLTAPESEYDFPKLCRLLDQRYDEWVAQGRPEKSKQERAEKSTKPWWKLW